ncbi:MAG: ADP-ribosylglycohydrolase family protein [Chloroflexota bacterium]|nr:ADP-ribosylglycohydrolase family protein [Chloroflexota bacterium]
MNEPSLADRLAGAVWGHLVGDAVGVPYEGQGPRPPEHVQFGASGSHGKPPGTWSDDGALMLALLDSLLEKGFGTTDQARHALAWYRDGAYTPDGEGRFDVGNATAAALQAIERGTPPEKAGAPDAAGNGSLMRILPLALVERDIPAAQLVDRAHRASRVTHGHRVADVACALYALVARRLLGGEAGRPRALADARTELRELYRSNWSADHLAALDHLEGYTERGGRGRVWDSFWSAWDAFAGADSYADTVRRAVAYGNDTDTTAAICGGLAGIHWGIDGIPADWLAGMRGKRLVWPLVGRLLRSAEYSTDDIRVDWVDLARVPGLRAASGRLGMTFLPGKRSPGIAGPHWRALEADVMWLREQHAVDTFLLLVEDHELERARVRDIAGAMAGYGIDLLRHPITDGGVPIDAHRFRQTLTDVERRLEAGKSVAVACMGGLGRTGTAVACILRDAGLGADEAIALTREARPGTLENDDQEAFVRRWPGQP